MQQLVLSICVLRGVKFASHELAMTHDETRELVQYGGGVDVLIDALSQHISAGNVSFPFKRLFVGDATAMFRRLAAYRPTVRREPFSIPNVRFNTRLFHFAFVDPHDDDDDNNSRRSYLCFQEVDTDYDEIDVLVDIFQVRLATR